jgi:hypothetical protein
VFALKAYNRWLIEEQLAPDFASKLRTPKVQTPPQPVVSDQDIEALLDTCTGRRFLPLRDAAIISCLASTGVRQSELDRQDRGTQRRRHEADGAAPRAPGWSERVAAPVPPGAGPPLVSGRRLHRGADVGRWLEGSRYAQPLRAGGRR